MTSYSSFLYNYSVPFPISLVPHPGACIGILTSVTLSLSAPTPVTMLASFCLLILPSILNSYPGSDLLVFVSGNFGPASLSSVSHLSLYSSYLCIRILAPLSSHPHMAFFSSAQCAHIALLVWHLHPTSWLSIACPTNLIQDTPCPPTTRPLYNLLNPHILDLA